MPRKGRFEFLPGNTSPDGHYVVGKGRPPEHGKFRKGDGRKRGRRPKGARNLANDLREELESSVTVTVGGVARKVSRQRAILMRLADNATKGQTSAIALTLDAQQRLIQPILEREEHESNTQKKPDFQALSYGEQKVLHYLLAKMERVEEHFQEIVGVIPIFKEGQHISRKMQEIATVGLLSYGIEVVCFRSYPPICRLMEKTWMKNDDNNV